MVVDLFLLRKTVKSAHEVCVALAVACQHHCNGRRHICWRWGLWLVKDPSESFDDLKLDPVTDEVEDHDCVETVAEQDDRREDIPVFWKEPADSREASVEQDKYDNEYVACPVKSLLSDSPDLAFFRNAIL